MLAQNIERLRAALIFVSFPTLVDGARLFHGLAIAALGMTVLTLGMLGLDDRTVAGEAVWLKPFKFSVSFAVLFGTLGFAAGRLSHSWRMSWIILAGAVASAAAFAFEMAYISAQAARQEASHFNESTPYHQMMYALMGTGATVLMVTIVIVGVAVWADRYARVGPGLKLGIGLGFLLTAVLTTWVAGELAGNGGRYVGLPGDGHSRIPLLGWSMEVGDLRPAHFFALHAMQVLPLAGHLADRYGAHRRSLWMAAVLYAIFTTVVFLQALRGAPLISA